MPKRGSPLTEESRIDRNGTVRCPPLELEGIDCVGICPNKQEEKRDDIVIGDLTTVMQDCSQECIKV